METKLCKKCNNELALERFAKYRRQTKAGIKEYVETYCKTCENKRRYDQKTNTPEKFEEYRRKSSLRRKKSYYANPDRENLKSLKHRYKTYGLTLEDYNTILEKQNGLCPICNRHQHDLIRNFDVDHCHATGKVRGLLCNLCNSGIGHLKDDIDYLKRAIEYLQTNS